MPPLLPRKEKQEWGTGLVDDDIPQGNATRRIALVHMDWDNIKVCCWRRGGEFEQCFH